MCSVSASAQDVIVKKDGSTIVCRVVEVTQTEVIYKKWTDLQGSNYVMERTNVSAINYEDGRNTSFGDTPATTTQTPTRFSTNAQQQQMSDDMLIRMAGKPQLSPIEKKIKRLKIAGWVAGAAITSAGAIMLGLGISRSYGEDYIYYSNSYYDYWEGYTAWEFLAPGIIGIVGGIATTTTCLIRAHHLKQQSQYSVHSEPLFQQDFKFKNGSSLATGVDFMQDNTRRNATLGLGLSYHF